MMVDAPSCYNESNNDGTLINADNDLRLHDAIKSHNGPSLKKMFLDPSQEIPLSDLSAEYTRQLSRLNQQDSSGNTPFHLLVLSKQWHTWHTKLMEWIVNYLHVIAHKIGKYIDQRMIYKLF